MKYKLALIFAIAFIILAKFTYDLFVPPFSKGDDAPQFSLISLEGKTVRLVDYRGSPVLVHFWATWCTQCVQEIPLLNEFTKLFPELKVLAVSEDDGGADAVLNFFGGLKPSFTVLIDSEGRVADKYKSYKVPESYLIDRDGKILHRFVGAVSWSNPRVAENIKKMLLQGS